MSRVLANNPQLQKPFKRYCIGKVWRYDEPQAGRMREFWQGDIDIVGTSSMEAEAECVACTVNCLENLGFKNFKIRVNNRKIVEGLTELAKIPKERTVDVYRVLDKLGKIGIEDVKKELKIRKITEEQTKKLLELIIIQGKAEAVIDKGRKLLNGIAVAEEGLREVETIFENCKRYGISDKIVVDFSLVRGLDYYTGPVFEVSIIAEKDLGSVAGGGRYDNLIELFGGRPTPATGISLGLERIIEIMKNENMFKVSRTKVKVFVANVDEKMKGDALRIAQQLRAKGIACQTDLMDRKLTKQLEYADSLGIPFVVVVGQKELKSKKFKLKYMEKKTEKELSLSEIIKILK
jgi:histidyl-tRNA synthetase